MRHCHAQQQQQQQQEVRVLCCEQQQVSLCLSFFTLSLFAKVYQLNGP